MTTIISPTQYLNELTKPLIFKIKDCIVPIFSFDENEFPYLKGSGVLISISNQNFLITANHVFSDADNFPPFFFSKNQFQQFNGNVWRVKKADNFSQDNLDIAVLKLNSIQSQELLDFHKFYKINSENIDYHFDPGVYLLLGYPFQRNKPNHFSHKIKRRIFPYFGPLITDEKILKNHNRLPPQNIAIGYKRKRVISDNNSLGQGPKVIGCSGGGIFKVKTLPFSNPPKVKLSLCAILIEYFENSNILVGTNLLIPIEIIRKKIPELEDLLPEWPQFKIRINC